MARKIAPGRLDAVRNAVQAFEGGATLDEIESKLSEHIPRRTLQRHLATLIAQKRVTVFGQARATRYCVPTPIYNRLTIPASSHVAEDHADEGFYPPLSLEGQAIRDSVRAPLPTRRPVGYERDFLDEYRPNETWYLPEYTRVRLADIGRSDGEERPAGTYARQIFNRLLIDLSWNSSRLEGNTYSLLETERLLSMGAEAEGRNAREAQMILNHKAAIELLVEQADEVGFNRYTILNLHALLSENLLTDPRASGRVRTIAVGIGGSVFHPLGVPQQVAECFEQILIKATAIQDPFEQAFFAMVQLPYLQPFEDVNKRVSRLAANIPLIRRNLSPLSFVDVPERAYVEGVLGVYELNRVELLRDVFVWAYERSCARYSAVRKSLGEPDLFRMRYKTTIADAVSSVVKKGMNKRDATLFIRRAAGEAMPAAERARFIEVVETELMSLHEGNIARFRLRPSEYEHWKQAWL